MAKPNSAKSIFLEASEMPLADRAVFLDQAVGGDAALRARVEALLKVHDDPVPGKSPFLAAGLPGDLKHDDTVDTADYIIWRNGLGTAYADAARSVSRANFGRTANDPAALTSTDPLSNVPEPATLLLAAVACSLMAAQRCRSNDKS
jgi:hypothetical protein